MRIVVSIGGNALTPDKGKGTYEELTKNIRAITKHLTGLIKQHDVAIVYGSGPQIGFLILQNEIAKKTVPPMPLHVLDAELQGELGYLLEQALQNDLRKHRVSKHVVSVLTQIIVDRKDPGFRNPTKPIGSFYTQAQSKALEKKGYKMTLQKGKGYRRVVASPKPVTIDGVNLISSLLRKNMVVIAAGGGGIPVIKKGTKLEGVEAVIDKDRASALLANQIKADTLLIITDIDKVYLDYATKKQKAIRKMSYAEAHKYHKQGQYPAGSMGPKVEAAITFLRKGGKQVIITSPNQVGKALKGAGGTLIIT